MIIQILALILDLIVAAMVGLSPGAKAKTPAGRSLILLALFSAVWSLSDLLYQRPGFVALAPLFAAFIYFVSMLAAAAQLAYVVCQINRQNWASRQPLWVLAIMPVLTQVLFWVKPVHDVLFGIGQPPTSSQLFFGSTWGKIAAVYVFLVIVAAASLLWNTYLERRRSLSMPYGAVLFGSLFPPVAATLEFAGFTALVGAELLPPGFTVAVITYAYHLFRHSPEAVPSIDRNAVIEGMEDGWMVLDNSNLVVDMNAAAERMAGFARPLALGQPVSSMLGSLPNLAQTFDQSQELEMKRSVKSQEGWKYLNIRLLPLVDEEGKPFGRLALWHDVTERRLTEDARQRARDEMLVLLNAISSAASNVVDLDDFLLESIYHIIYPFRSQVVSFFLLDEKSPNKEDARFVRSAHLGLSAEAAAALASVPVSSPLFAPVLDSHEPLQIEDVDSDGRVHPAFQGMGLACLLMLPLMNQSGDEPQMLGCMCLGRKEMPSYTPDEIVRLSMISDQIGALIDSDRRRKLAITSTERKRLMRDLHDSVSQKLYGLVTTTEAAQAAMEAGSQFDTSDVLARIGENARQAVKEMRLFLFQMQPIDIEKDGLISLLHHRLAAVEGRADIKARLRADLADDEVALSPETEVVLYYIAQEALNNVLRHASAKSISVTLKQGRRNVILEIIDDGCGFDPKKVERGGLGLSNMQERTAQIHGKLQIVSKPEGGTRVVITVPRDPSVKPIKHRR